MAEKVARVGVRRDKKFMYFIRGGDVWRVRRVGGKRELVARAGVTMDRDYTYFLDGDGDVSRVARAVLKKDRGSIGGESRSTPVAPTHDGPVTFTHYWANDTWEREKRRNAEEVGQLLDHTAGNLFRKRGVRTGDRIYIVTNLDGTMYVSGRMTVTRIVSQAEAESERGEPLWDADEHVLGTDGTPMRFDNPVPVETVRQLRFGDGKTLLFDRGHHLDRQTLRGVRRLTLDSARVLDALLERPARGRPSSTKGTPSRRPHRQ